MAASSSKPTAVHFALVFFVVLTIVLGVLYYVEHGAAVDASVKAARVMKESAETQKLVQAEVRNIRELIRLIKGATGSAFGQIGSFETPDNAQDTLIGSAQKDLEKLSLPAGEISYRRLVEHATAELKARMDELAAAKRDQADREKAFKDLEAKYQALYATEKSQRDTSENQLREVTRNKDETVTSLDKDKHELQKAYQELDTAFLNAKLAFEKDRKAFDGQVVRLTDLNHRLEDWLKRATQKMGEKPTGLVRHVDLQSRLVYINLGKADRLPLRMTLNVYEKNRENGGNSKAEIEVARIIDNHVAECRITQDDIYNPIAQGDPVFTPLWTPGQVQRYAFAGVIDIDNDGRDDRSELHELVKNADAVIDVELLPHGEIQGRGVKADIPMGMTERTRFLILGKVPESTKAGDEAEVLRINKFKDNLKKMQESAHEYGVKVITLTDFLNYIGYRPTRSLNVPASEASHQVHPEFEKIPVKPPTSKGVQSKLFKAR